MRDAVEPMLPGATSTGLDAWFYAARGRVRLAEHEAAGALSDLLLVGHLLESHGITSPVVVPWRSHAVLAAEVSGAHDEAILPGDEAIAVAKRFGLPAALGASLRARGLIEGGPNGLRLLAEAVDVLEDADAALELARALADLGGGLRREGRRLECREPLRRALDLTHRCGARALEHQVLDELLARGARPRRAVMTGVDALTPSERRIARLAATGQTNRAIAETLSLIKNIIGWHLRQIYRKLGVSARGVGGGDVRAARCRA